MIAVREWKKITVVVLGILGVSVVSWLFLMPDGYVTHLENLPHDEQVSLKDSHEGVGAASLEAVRSREEREGIFMKKLSDMEREIQFLKKQDAKEAVSSVPATEITDDQGLVLEDASIKLPEQREQMLMQARAELESRVMMFDNLIQNGDVDEAQTGGLQQRVESALNVSSISHEVAIKSTQCSSSLCKVETSGQPSGEQDVLHLLLEQNAFGDGTEIFAVPDQNNHDEMTFYFSPGKVLPSQPSSQ